ncbi:MAG: hypothetical protein II183_01225 [Elusimicrobiaceae bacterium]|nr:hypothetical protein [Elusimicrobiaceae bacterium]
MIFSSANALEISAFKAEDDGEATITFCKTLKIENVSLNKDSVVQTVVFEKDDGEFENISLLNNIIANKIISCFEGVCDIRTSCKTVPYALISARKVIDRDLVVVKVNFDRDISAIFLISSYQKKNKTLYRVTMPQDLKFLSGKYKRKLRNWLINEAKNLL